MSLRVAKGFSLIELLVVIVIIALASSLAVAWLAGRTPSDRLRDETRILSGEFQLAATVATTHQRVIGWQPVTGGYRFVAWQPTQGWQTFGERSGLEARQWSQEVQPTRVPGVNDNATPWLIWLPDGEVVGARLILASGGARREITVDALGVHPRRDAR